MTKTEINAMRRCGCRTCAHLLSVFEPQPMKVHAVWQGNTKETVCEHEFTMFDKSSETWADAKGSTLITCRTCRDILRLPPLT